MPIFDVTPKEIAQLNDTDLRELVGRLCEAELVGRGVSPAAVTWGGNQTAADGGLDVRVALVDGIPADGFVPRPSTGFQVKTPDMGRAAILEEMRPGGVIRPVIQELANEAGAYVIVSSHGSTADTPLQNRRAALREALSDVDNADRLYTDFYDRTRLATWVRLHPGLITWVKEKIGRALVGWRPYGSWSSGSEIGEAEYIIDDTLRIHLGTHRDRPAQPIADGVDELRDVLAQPGKMVRLVGLSGVGKTRFVEALFDPRLGARALPTSLAVYTNLADNPDPQPIGLASDLIANRTQAVLIVDNCPPDLHRRLSDICAAPDSSISVITVEYDVRDDQPEGTQVVTLEASSPDLIQKLIRRRYPPLSEVNARTIAQASGGNARIAIALAGTIENSETVAGLSDDELFQRLFRQRHEANDELLLAAQACSLVYSFEGEALTGDNAEVPRLAVLAEQTPQVFYRHVRELLRRDLVQQRNVWRAVLPHAIANRLAARALEDTPYEVIDQCLVTGGTERLQRSFSRRLSFLHDHPIAVTIVERWLAHGGLLGDVTSMSDLGGAMFENVAPVSPLSALAALERARTTDPEAAVKVWRQHLALLRSLAYDPALFERSISLIGEAATQSTDEQEAKEAADAFCSLFTIYLSGTHATIEQRLGVIEQLLQMSDVKARTLGFAALDRMLETTHFSSGHQFEFGARSRDYGHHPRSFDDVNRWYRAALRLVEHFAVTQEVFKPELQRLVTNNFRGLWTRAGLHSELEGVARRFAADGFWREGWAACLQTIHFDAGSLTPEASSRLASLEVELRPSNLQERVRAVVLGDASGGLDIEIAPDDDIESALQRHEAMARELGTIVAADHTVFLELLPDLLRGGNRVFDFGRGLAEASQDRHATFAILVEGLTQLSPEHRNVQVIRGFLAEIWERDQSVAQDLLDEAALDQSALLPFLPALHTAVQLDVRGIERLRHALNSDQVPIWTFRNLALGRTTDHVPGADLRDLLLAIADHPDGFDVAVEILSMRLYSDRSDHRQHEPELIEAGRLVLRRVRFKRGGQRTNRHLADVAEACLMGVEGVSTAREIAGRLKRAVIAYETYAIDNDDILRALLSVQPIEVLNTLFDGGDEDRQTGVRLFDERGHHGRNRANEISSVNLIAWCNQEPGERYRIAASIISFAHRTEENGQMVWTDGAKALLAHAPDPSSVLEVFVGRFRPMSWSGSLAVAMEENARLLESVELQVSEDLIRTVIEAQDELAQEIARVRQHETDRDRTRDERFE